MKNTVQLRYNAFVRRSTAIFGAVAIAVATSVVAGVPAYSADPHQPHRGTIIESSKDAGDTSTKKTYSGKVWVERAGVLSSFDADPAY
ncbi:MAG: hypothetical protein Q4A71_04620, partial [Actinomycetaceae bacterium]|nr:hypothetical protein [Actinomycetaceae bacterium]